MDDFYLNRARALMEGEGCTCAVCGPETELRLRERGVQPLLELLSSGRDLTDCYAADRVVGKAAAFLYVLLGVRAVYAGIVSVPAAEVLGRYCIPLSYGEKVPAIRNRTNTGFCPMETAVWEIEEPAEALAAIKKARQSLADSNKR